MSGVTVILGSAASSVSPIITAALPAASALFAVWLTLWSTDRRSGCEQRLNRGVVSLGLAEHLEEFVIHCSDVTRTFRVAGKLVRP